MSAIDRALAAQARAAVIAANTPLDWWARSYRGVQPRFATMATPPVVTIGGANATVNANTGYATSATWDSGRITLPAALGYISDGASPTRAIAQVLTASTGLVYPSPVQRARFVTDATAFEIPFRGQFGEFNLLVDGEMFSRTRGVAEFLNDGYAHQIKVDFGAGSRSLYLDQLSVSAAGSGYALGDTITLAGGSFSSAAMLKVTQVSGTGVAAVAVVAPGAYSAVATLTQGATSGGGSGATFTAPVYGASGTTRRARRIELLWTGATPFPGVNLPAGSVLLPAPISPRVPTLLVLGDSQQNTYVDYPGGYMGGSIAQRLGLWDNHVVTQAGGTGYLTPNGTSLPWSDARRIADVVRARPDIVLIIGGQNDSGQTASALTAAVTTMLNALLDQLPGALIVGIGPVTGGSATLVAAIAAGWAAARDQRRVRFIDNVTVPWVTGAANENVLSASPTGNAGWMVASDGTHLCQAGYDGWADIAAPRIADQLLRMIG